MKTTFIKWYPQRCLLLVLVSVTTAMCNGLFAQTPTLEFASAGASTTTKGPSIAAQVITFQNNTNNPTGTTFATYTPTTTATFFLSNQQYTLSTTESATATALMFGAGNTNATPAVTPYYYYNLLNNYSGAANADFTSASTIAAGTGIDITKNYGLQVFTSAMGLYHAGSSTSGRYYIADLTITFSSYVTNPIIHIMGVGASFGGLGFSTELELKTPSVTLIRLSGSTEFTVSGGTKILNSATTLGGTTGSGAASGSVLVSATYINTLTFKVYLRGDGGGAAWSTGNHSGDGWLLSVSTPTALVTLPLTITNFMAASLNTHAQLQWDAAIEDNSIFFNIESSRDGVVWKNIGKVMSAGNSNTINTYHFADVDAAAGNNYYRIGEVNAQGDVVYSPVKSVNLEGNFNAGIFPNPVKDKLYITTNGGMIKSIGVADMNGREMYHYNNLPPGNSLDMSPFPTGLYVVTIRYTSGQVQTMKVVKE